MNDVKRPIGIIALIWLLISCGGFPTNSDNTANPTIAWGDTNSVACYGTQITAGVGANSDSTYPGFLQQALRIDVVNLGISGATSLDGVKQLSTVFSEKPVIVLLEFGFVEYLNDVEPAEIQPNLETMIEAMQDHGIHVVLLSFAHPDMKNLYPDDPAYQPLIQLGIRYYQMYQQLSSLYDIPMVDYIFQDIWGDPVLMADEIYPNGKGYRQMEYNIMDTLYSIFDENGMLK